jgi:tetratricopeptide (TPR) repeat protein
MHSNQPPSSAFAQATNPRQRLIEAIAACRQRLIANPARPDDWYELARMLKQAGQYDAALEAYGQAIRHQVDRAEEVYLNCAVIHTDHLGNHAAAEDALRLALRLNPTYVPAWLNLGNLCEEQGRRAEAVDCYERILIPAAMEGPHDQLRLEALARLVQLRDAAPNDPWLRQLEEAAGSAQGIDNPVRANLCFALGRVKERLELFDEAFGYFTKANEWVRREGRAYDPKATERLFDALIASTAAPVAASAPADDSAAQPLFICGMFRSGSTLIEQVLNAHPEVAMGGELPYFPQLAAGPLAPYPSGLDRLGAANAAAIAQQYRELSRRLLPPEKSSARYLSDKRPDNFMLLGLIKRVFPAARIIHTTRNPLDVGLSIYQQHLDPRAASYSCELTAIGHYYGQYQRLMRHVETVHAKDLIRFDYDDFVAAPEPALRRLLDFLQLPWHAGCLDFHQQKNTVKTASYWQVRQPLYRDASGRSRHYARQLEPLREALESAGVVLRRGE